MAQIYVSYLAKFLKNETVSSFLLSLLQDEALFDWQRLWVLAALSQVSEANDNAVKIAWDLLKDASRHDALRAAAAIYVGRFGDHARRKALISLYGNVSAYVQAAIYFSSRAWPSPERATAKASWGSHGPLNSLLTVAMSKA